MSLTRIAAVLVANFFIIGKNINKYFFDVFVSQHMDVIDNI